MKLFNSACAKGAVIAGLLAGGSILAVSAFAVPAGAPVTQERCAAARMDESPATREAYRTAHLAELKARLKLTAGQEAAWDTFAKSGMSGTHDGDADRQALRDEFAQLNTPQRLDKMLALADARRAGMVERVKVVKAFYAQLTPEQQSVFDALALTDGPRGQRHHHA